ncbi:flippase-like domain-containing protein, partial [bacterium]|nr:flippase-like domain-containing protein [bacterium]
MNRALNVIKPLLLWLTAGCLVYAIFGFVLGWHDFRQGLARFPPTGIPLLVGLSLANYLMRFGRWSLYLSRLSLEVPRRESWALFFATFAMVVTPGKLGEIYKAVHLRDKRGVPLSAGLSVLIAERLTDVLAILLLAAVGLFWWDGLFAGTAARAGALLILVLAVASLRSGRLQTAMISRLSRSSRLRDRAEEVRDTLNWLPAVTSGSTAAASLSLSVAAWFCECLSLWLICGHLGHHIGL